MLTTYVRTVPGKRELLTMLRSYTPTNISSREQQKIPQFADLLEKIFILDPERRVSVEDALNHPFIKEDVEK